MKKHEILPFAAKEAEQVHNSLKKARTPDDLRAVTAKLHRRIDEVFTDLLKSSGQTIACRAGCSFCCYIKVDAMPQEIFRLVDFIRTNFSLIEIDELLSRAESNKKRITEMSFSQQMTNNIPCALLKNGQCSCYEARPAMCRKHHARNVWGCEQTHKDPQLIIDSDEVAEIQYPMAALVVMAQEAYRHEGYDCTSYDLSSALSEALTNPKCEKRWRDKKIPFTKACIAKEPPC